jgi:hypothetical protein
MPSVGLLEADVAPLLALSRIEDRVDLNVQRPAKVAELLIRVSRNGSQTLIELIHPQIVLVAQSQELLALLRRESQTLNNGRVGERVVVGTGNAELNVAISLRRRNDNVRRPAEVPVEVPRDLLGACDAIGIAQTAELAKRRVILDPVMLEDIVEPNDLLLGRRSPRDGMIDSRRFGRSNHDGDALVRYDSNDKVGNNLDDQASGRLCGGGRDNRGDNNAHERETIELHLPSPAGAMLRRIGWPADTEKDGKQCAATIIKVTVF